ncbi:MAG: DsbA family protein [Thermoleophilia bacterium]
MSVLHITEYSDPSCPFAFSAEPSRRRLQWLYGAQIAWDIRVVGLADSAEALEARGTTTEFQASVYARLEREHGMPFDSSPRERMAASVPACRAVVAARLDAGPRRARALLRRIAVATFAGDLIDDPATIRAAARAAGFDARALDARCGDSDVAEALAQDMAAARNPTSAARAQRDRLATWEGGLRYTCPSYEITRVADGAGMSAPGFQPFGAYEMAVANLAPHLERRPDARDPREVLSFFDEPLATREVAVVMGITDDEARELLEDAGAVFDPVGADGYWSGRAGPEGGR